MSRRISPLTNLVQSADAAGYTLPAEVLDEFDKYRRVAAIEIPTQTALTINQAAGRVVAAVAADEPTDLLALAEEVNRTVRADEGAVTIARLAIEIASEGAAIACADRGDQIITDHLRPALDAVHAEARDVADELAGYDLENPHELVAAPAKSRAAYGKLPALVNQRQLIYTARRWVNTIAGRAVQHDSGGIFSEFAKPFALVPDWKWAPGVRVPAIPAPTDPAARLIWVVSDAVAVAKPWLPLVHEQDSAWQAQFGAAVEARKQHAHNARAIAATIGGG